MLKVAEYQKQLNIRADIILVEDSDDDAELTLSVFEKNNIDQEILRLRDGAQGIEYFRALATDKNEYKPKVVLLDYNLPKMLGVDVLRTIRSYPATRNLPVMMITGNEKETSESFKLGISSFITKNSGYEAFEKSLLEIQLYLNHFKVLILEDGMIDSQLIENALRDSKIQFTAKTATNEREYLDALHHFKPDVIYSDFAVQKYDAIRAIRALKNAGLNIPFILVTGTLNEEFASGCLSEGIDDYLLKSNLIRLPSSLVNALRKKKNEEEKIKIQKELVRTNKELNTLFNNIDQVFFSVDIVSRKVIQISEACKTVLGYPPEKFLNDVSFFYKTIIHPEDREKIPLADDFLYAGKTVHREFRIIYNDGSIRWVSSKIIPTLDDSGKLVRIDGYTSDITEKKNAELKYNELNSLIYRLAHDLRGPVSSIGLLTFAAKEKATDEKMRMMLDTISQSNKNLQNILTDMIELIKLCGTEAKKEKVDFKDITNQILGSISHLPERKNVTIETQIRVHRDFYSDKQSCYSVLYNLIHNAMVYRRNIPDSFVKITIESHPKNLSIQVTDNGSGIPNEMKDGIFEKFVRANKTVSGSGLGLYIVKNAVEKLRGVIMLESTQGQGTAFSVVLPYA